VENIQKRGREYEENIRLDYLKRLNKYYDAWIDEYREGPLLVIDANNVRFQENPEDLGEIISRVESQLHGLF
jgi:deoxyadenosine/deoxycytidine kinase